MTLFYSPEELGAVIATLLEARLAWILAYMGDYDRMKREEHQRVAVVETYGDLMSPVTDQWGVTDRVVSNLGIIRPRGLTPETGT